MEGTGGRRGGLLDHTVGGCVYLVLGIGWGNDLLLGGGTPESGQGWAAYAVSIEGGVVPTRVDAAGRRGRTTVRNRLKVAAARAGRVGISVVGSGVIRRADG